MFERTRNVILVHRKKSINLNVGMYIGYLLRICLFIFVLFQVFADFA